MDFKNIETGMDSLGSLIKQLQKEMESQLNDLSKEDQEKVHEIVNCIDTNDIDALKNKTEELRKQIEDTNKNEEV